MTRGGQLRRRASSDRALKGPTPHAPSRCQLSFLSPLPPSFRLLADSLARSLPLRTLAMYICAFKSLSLPFLPRILSFSQLLHPSPPPTPLVIVLILAELHGIVASFLHFHSGFFARSSSFSPLLFRSTVSSSCYPPLFPPSSPIGRLVALDPRRVPPADHGGEYRVSS